MIENVRIHVSESIVEANTSLLRSTLKPSTKIIAVIKANGYGLGLTEIAHTCEKLSIDILAVLDLPQAIALRNAGIKSPILLLGQTHSSDFDKLIHYDCIQVLLSEEFGKKLAAYGQSKGLKMKCHLKVNSGLNRLGYDDYESIEEAYNLEGLDIQGIYTHFVAAQDYSSEAVAFSKFQQDRFDTILDKLKKAGIHPGMTHIQNSPSILRQGDLGYDAVRCGMVLFGLFHPSQLQLAIEQGYQVPFTFESQIALVRNVEKGDFIGYGRSFEVSEKMKVATISAGYCDGILKNLSLNGGGVIINGVWCPILGDIAMSQFMIDVSNVDCKAEDSVYFIDGLNQTLYDFIGVTNQSINEFIGSLRIDIPRIYK